MNGSPSKKWTPPADAQPIMTTDPEKKPWAPPSEAIPVEQVKKKEDTESVPASGNGTTTQTSVDGSKPSESGTPPTEKPTARAKLKSRVQDLSKLYQNKFQEGLQPFLDTQQKEYEGAINSKKAELEALVGSGKLNVADANSQLKEFSTVKKGEFDKKINNQQALESDKFNKLHGKEISKWLNLYNDQYYKEDFEENKISNPAESFGKTAWSTFTQDIPSSIYAARALGRSAKGKVDQQIANAFDKIGIPKINGEDAEHVFSQALKFITGATDEQIAKSFEVKAETMDASNKKLVVEDLQAATELSNASAESKKYLINNLDKVKTGDWLDTMNYVASAAGQGAGQIPASIGTRGTTSLIQEMGGIYLDSVNKIAQESGLSIEEVIKQGKDDVVFPIVFGLGAGLLDAYGANKVSGAFSKKQVLDSFRKRAVALAKTSGYETITEGAQGALEEIGVNKATGKTWAETFNAIDPDIIKESAIQGGIAGLFLGGAGQVVQKGITAMAPKIEVPKVALKTYEAAIKGGAKESLQADVKTTDEVIEEQKNVVDTTNPESVKQAAETIQNKFNEHTDTDKSQPIKEGVETNVQQSVQQKADTQEPATISGGLPAGDQSNIQQAGNTGVSEKPITDDKGTYDFSGVRQQLSAGQEATPEQQNPEATAGETLNTEDNGQNQRNEGEQKGLLDSTSKQAGQLEDLEQPASTIPDVPDVPEEQMRIDTPVTQKIADYYSDVTGQPRFTGEVGSKEFYDWIKQTKLGNDVSFLLNNPQKAVELITKNKTDEQNTTTQELQATDEQRTLQGREVSTATEQQDAPVHADASRQRESSVPQGNTVADQSNETQESKTTTSQPASESTPQSESGRYEFKRPIQSPPPTTEKAVQPPDGGTPLPKRKDNTNPPKGERATIVKLQDQSTLSDALKEGIEDFKEYTVKKQSRSREQAQKYIKRVGEDQALQDAISFKFARPQEEKMALLSELAEQFSGKFKAAEKEGNQEKVDQYYSKFMTTMNTLSNLITDTAQALSYLNLVGTVFQTKTGALRFAKNQIEQSREGAMKNYEEMKMTAEQLIKEFDKLPTEDFLKSKQVQDLIAKMRNESPKSHKIRQADKNVKDAADRLRDVWNENKNLGAIYDPKSQAEKDVKLTKALIAYVKALLQKFAVEAGDKIQNVTDQVVSGVKSFAKEIALEISDEDVNDIVQETVAREFERKYKGDIRTSIQDYVENKTGRSELLQRIVDTEGLSEEQAEQFTKQFDKIFEEYLTKEKHKLVNRFTPKTRKPNKKRQEFYDKVIKLSNTGAVSDQQLEDAIANIFGLPEMTPQIATKIEDMVEDINKAPEGRFKNIAITKLTDYIATQQKFNITDYMLASFRAGIFSGIDTQALNLMGNFFNVLEMGFMLSMVNPKAAARFISSVRNPTSLSRAGMEALEIIKTGYDPRIAGDAKRRVLEQSPRTLFGFGKGLKGWKQALDPTLEQQKKYVFRALSAGDILFSQGINDALQQEMYARAAKAQGLKGSEARAYVREKMGFTPEKIDASLQKAIKEAQDGAIPQDENSISLRAKEIIEQQRDPDIIEKSREYAQEQILTNPPKGYIGIIARGLNSMIQQLPVLSALIPVVNFAANAMRRAVQFLPPAALTRGAAHYTQRMIQGENLSTIIKDDINRLKSGDLEQEMRLRRFAAGTVSLIMLAALLDDDDDGDNLLSKAVGKTVKIHGSGPGTKLNRQKTYQKQETGYLPYSVQIGDTYIPYKNYPGLNVLLSTFGEYQDAKRYGKLDKKDALNRMVFAVCNSFAVISEMGFLTSLNTTTQAFLEANPKEFTSLVTRPVGGLLFPKFQRNLLNFFDNQVYSGRDVQEIAIRSIPVLNTAAGDPLLNALGENVERNWWDRIELWNSESYTDHKPIWDANMKNNYYIPVPSKASLEDVFDKPLTTSEYNKFFKLRGEEIIKNFTPEMTKLNPDDYARKMDAIVEFGKYKALVQMGAMDSDLMKEIKFQLYDLYDTKRESQELKKQIKP